MRTRATGEPTWGKTGTTDDNGDAWFCGATEEITACVWVGHADTVTPMLTEFAGAPVDGGTIPALIFADVVNAYEEIEDARKAGEDPETSPTETVPSDAPAVAAEPTEPEVSEPAPTDDAAESAAPSGDTDAGAAGGTPASGGGIAPG